MDLLFFISLVPLSFFIIKYSIYFLPKTSRKLIIDNQFKKPQAFHKVPLPRTGGIGIFLSFFLIFLYFYYLKNFSSLDYLSFLFLFFFLGIMDDIKINFNPQIRLLLMSIFLIGLIITNNFYIKYTGIELLNNSIEASLFFSVIFVSLCFLFIVNGANLIDGYNGLLTIHSLIILSILFLINFTNNNLNLAYILLAMILILIIFLSFNFPIAKMFLGDSGAYFLGCFLAISTIKTNIALPLISPFFFCIILFYLFIEVFFSFIRKLIFEKKNPLMPDKKHLHMIIYRKIFS